MLNYPHTDRLPYLICYKITNCYEMFLLGLFRGKKKSTFSCVMSSDPATSSSHSLALMLAALKRPRCFLFRGAKGVNQFHPRQERERETERESEKQMKLLISDPLIFCTHIPFIWHKLHLNILCNKLLVRKYRNFVFLQSKNSFNSLKEVIPFTVYSKAYPHFIQRNIN